MKLQELKDIIENIYSISDERTMSDEYTLTREHIIKINDVRFSVRIRIINVPKEDYPDEKVQFITAFNPELLNGLFIKMNVADIKLGDIKTLKII